MHLRYASQGIRVLDLVGVAVMAQLEGRAAEEMAKLAGHCDLTRVGPGKLIGGSEGDLGTEQGLDTHRRGHTRSSGQSVGVGQGEGAEGTHHLGPVEQGEPLLGLQPEWLEADLGERFAG